MDTHRRGLYIPDGVGLGEESITVTVTGLGACSQTLPFSDHVPFTLVPVAQEWAAYRQRSATDVVSENGVVRRTPEKLSWWEDHRLTISKMSSARKMSRTTRIINASHPSMQGIHCPSDGHESPAREPGLCPTPDLSIECGMQHLTRRMALFRLLYSTASLPPRLRLCDRVNTDIQDATLLMSVSRSGSGVLGSPMS